MAHQWHTPRWFYVLSCSLISVLGWQVAGLAQLTPDGTLGNESSVVTPNVPVQGTPADLIEGGAQRGSALFHSFTDFNVNDLQRVYFANPAGVLDIFTRVTGSNISNIDGTLGVDGMANLFLLNPNGVYFGPNARLDLRGSFLASTADSFTFGDDLVFGASDPQGAPPLLTVHITPGLQYGSQSATVTNQGVLEADQNLTLAGHRLEVGGELRAGRDIVLQGAERQLSEGTYTVGGYLFTQDLTGAGVEMVSPHPNTIVASGDVRLEAGYEGPSLHILAGGQVVAGTNNITVTSGTGGSVTETLSDGAGGTQAVTVNATDQPTVDIRSGVDFANLMGTVPGNTNTSGLSVSFGEATGQEINLRNITNSGGEVSLRAPARLTVGNVETSVLLEPTVAYVDRQNGGSITLISEGDIRTGSLSSASEILSTVETEEVVGGSGGNIILIAGNDIFSENLSSDSYSISYAENVGGDVTGGDGGNIILAASNDIETGDLSLYSFSSSISPLLIGFSSDAPFISNSSTYPFGSSVSGDVIGGNGGALNLIAGSSITTGSISTNSSSSSSTSRTIDSYSGRVVGRNGGDIFLSARDEISTESQNSSSYSSSFSGEVIGGNGGVIVITSRDGNISVEDLFSYSDSGSNSFFNNVAFGEDVVGGNGGDIILGADTSVTANSLDSSSGTYMVPFSVTSLLWSLGNNLTGGNGGNISISVSNSFSEENVINVADINSASETFSGLYALSGAFSIGSFYFPGGEITGGNAGTISLSSSDTISAQTVDSSSSTFTVSSFHAGNITGGDGSSVLFEAGNLIDINDIKSFSFALGESTFGEINTGRGGDIQLEAGSGSINGMSENLEQASLLSFSVAPNGQANNAGDVSLVAAEYLNNLEILTFSSSLQSGKTLIIGITDLEIENTDVVTSKQIEVEIEIGNPLLIEPIDIEPITIILPVGEQGASGNVTLHGFGDLVLINSSILSDTNGIDAAGNILIDSPARITFNNSSINTSTQNIGLAGNITVNANQDFTLVGENSRLEATTNNLGNAGNIEITASQMTLEPGSLISTSTSDSGSAGNITFNAHAIHLNGGRLETNTTSLTNDAGSGGNIAITASTFTAANGGQVQSITEGSANAGNMTFTLQEGLFLDGANTGLFATTTAGSSGRGGSIVVDPPLIQLTDGAQISVSSDGTGPGGDITLNADVLSLSDASRIIAETASASGGNITLNVADLLWMRYGSLISATAGTNLGAGDGGNITITNPQGFIIGVPTENSDITANAFAGRGGNVNISTYGLFGLDYRPTLTPLSDITASSNFGFDGTVNIAIGGVDLSRLQEELATNLVDASQLVQQSYCDMGRDNEFIVTGRGGIPNNPREQLRPDGVLTDWVRLDAAGDSSGAANPSPTAAASPPDRIVEATHLVADGEGNVRLVSDQADYRSPDYWPLPGCNHD
jgi:filamentous hemagglutinin family protein